MAFRSLGTRNSIALRILRNYWAVDESETAFKMDTHGYNNQSDVSERIVKWSFRMHMLSYICMHVEIKYICISYARFHVKINNLGRFLISAHLLFLATINKLGSKIIASNIAKGNRYLFSLVTVQI